MGIYFCPVFNAVVGVSGTCHRKTPKSDIHLFPVRSAYYFFQNNETWIMLHRFPTFCSSWLLLVVSSLLVEPNAIATAQTKKGLRASAVKVDITPPLGGSIVGGFRPYPATNVHDRLHARCLVLDDGKTKLVFVVCDLLGIDRLVSDDARSLVEKRLRIPKANVLISATHTHSACSALGKDARIISDQMDGYQRFVSREIVKAVTQAVKSLRPAEIGWGKAKAPEHVFNRRWYLKPGKRKPNPFGKMDTVRMNPPRGKDILLKPAGPTDPDVPFLAVREPNGKFISVFTTYSLHYVGGVGRGDISADYFAMYCEELARFLKADKEKSKFVALMANGTSGDINNINFRNPRPRKKPYEQMKHVAHEVARKVHKSMARVKYRSDVTLGARYRELAITTRKADAVKLLSWAKKKLANMPKEPKRLDLSYVYAKRTLRMAKHPEKLKMPLQAFRIGDVGIAAMPCEVFCEIGLEFKKRSPLQPAWMVSLAHGYYGYLPTPRHHKLGGYETWLGTNRLEPRASEKMLSDLLRMVKEFKGNGE